MTPVFHIEVRGDLLKRLPELSDGRALAVRLCRVMDQQNLLTVSHIQERYLSFPKQGPTTMDGLRVISNRLRGSIRAAGAVASGDGVTSSIGSNVSYAFPQEFGADIPPHDIVARNAKALMFIGKNGQPVFRRVIHHPGSHLPARAPIQRGIQDRLNDYNEAFNTAIEEMLN